MYKVNNKPSRELIEKLNDDKGIWFRWQNPEWEISGEHLESWSMCASSKEEALEDAREGRDTWDEEDAILPGKSCMPTLKEIMRCDNAIFDGYVLMAFEGDDTYVTGHDGEYVADFVRPVAIFSLEDSISFYEENSGEWWI